MGCDELRKPSPKLTFLIKKTECTTFRLHYMVVISYNRILADLGLNCDHNINIISKF